MRAYIGEVWRFLRGRPDHPIYRREKIGWSYTRLWRGLRKGCLPLASIFVIVISCCCTLPLWQLVPKSTQASPFVIGAALLGGYWASEIILLVAGLTATLITSTSISAEIEASTFALIRLTPIPPRQIVLAKFSAGVRELRSLLALVLCMRAIFLIGIAVIITIVAWNFLEGLRQSGVGTAPLSSAFQSLPFNPSTIIWLLGDPLGILLVAAILFVWLIYFFAQPVVDILLFGAIGLFGSSLARTRASGIFTAGGLRVVHWVGLIIIGMIVSIISSLITFSMISSPFAPSSIGASSVIPNILPVYLAQIGLQFVSTLIYSIMEVALILLLLYFTEKRVERLGV